MKTFLITLFVIFSLHHQLSARASFQTKKEMIEQADAIAVITISDVRDTNTKGKGWAYRKKGTAKVESTLKGKLPDQFVIYGHESFRCAHCPLSKGRFLAFLKKDGDLWAGANWHLSLRLIRDGKVEWYPSDEQLFPMSFQDLETVISSIEEQLATAPKANKPE